MDNIVQELRKIVPFKDTTDAGDIVLIASKKPQMLLYALVTDLQRDQSKAAEWWHVTMQLLTLPPRQVVWTLRIPQMTGREIFTMEGEERFVQALDIGRPPKISGDGSKGKGRQNSPLRVVK